MCIFYNNFQFYNFSNANIDNKKAIKLLPINHIPNRKPKRWKNGVFFAYNQKYRFLKFAIKILKRQKWLLVFLFQICFLSSVLISASVLCENIKCLERNWVIYIFCKSHLGSRSYKLLQVKIKGGVSHLNIFYGDTPLIHGPILSAF